MGRDTRLTIENKKEYDKLTKVQEVLEFDDIDGETFHWLELYSEKLKWKSHVEEIAYWGKSNCTEIVKIMRKYNPKDGDVVLNEKILNDIDHLINEKQLRKILYCFRQEGLLVVYNTNG